MANVQLTLIGVGVVLSIAGFAATIYADRQYRSHAVHATAIVVSSNPKPDADSNAPMFRTTFKWTASDALTHEVTRDDATKRLPASSLPIRYDSTRPKSAYIGPSGAPDNAGPAMLAFIFDVLVLQLLIQTRIQFRGARQIRTTLAKSEWLPARIETWTVGLFGKRTYLLVRSEDDQVRVFVQMAECKRWLWQASRSLPTSVDVAGNDEFLVVHPTDDNWMGLYKQTKSEDCGALDKIAAGAASDSLLALYDQYRPR